MPPKRKSRKVEQIQPTLPVLRPPSPQTNTPDNTSNRRAQESQEIPNATIVGTQLRVITDASQLSPTQWQQVELMRNSRLQATSSINLPATHQAPPMRHVSINAVEEERYQVINAYMSHWIQFALYRSPESYQAAVAMDYRLFLAEIASLYVSTDMRKRGFFDPPKICRSCAVIYPVSR